MSFTMRNRRFVSGGGYGPNDVVLTREIAPGQTMDFFVYAEDEGLQLTPLR